MSGSLLQGGFGAEVAKDYASAKNPHGSDGFLIDGPIINALNTYARPGTVWADAGGGSGWLALEIARRGPRVWYSDLSPTFVGIARAAFGASEFGSQIEVAECDVCELPYPDGSLDAFLLSNVGCAVSTLGLMFSSVARKLKPGGVVIATAPATLERVFTTDVNEDSAIAELEAELVGATSYDALKAIVERQTKFHRATFYWRDGRYWLVNGVYLPDGADIVRLISGQKPLAVKNAWHTDREYRWAIGNAGLTLGKDGVIETVLDADRRTGHNCGKPIRETLGLRYEYEPPFRMYIAKKPNP